MFDILFSGKYSGELKNKIVSNEQLEADIKKYVIEKNVKSVAVSDLFKESSEYDLSRFEILFNLLDQSVDVKLKFWSEVAKEQGIYRGENFFIGSFYPNTPYNFVNYCGESLFVVSINSPVDGIFFPVLGLIVTSTFLKFEVVRSAEIVYKQVIKSIIQNKIPKINDNLDLLLCIKDNRPAHVFFDEISGAFEAEKILEKPIKKIFSTNSGFIEPELIPDSLGEADLHRGYQRFFCKYIMLRSHSRLRNNFIGNQYKQWLKSIAVKSYNLELEKMKGKKCFWIGITAGERRSWVEEDKSIVLLIKWILGKYPESVIVFDGYTGNSKNCNNEFIIKHNKVLEGILVETDLKSEQYVSLVGSQILRKIAFGSVCDFFVTIAGTPSNWISNVCRVPGILHGNTVSVEKNKLNYNLENTIKIPVEFIKDIDNEFGSLEKYERGGGFVNYSIDPHIFIEFCASEIVKALKENDD